MDWKNFEAKSNWYENQNFYGKIIKISRNRLIGISVIICLITPCTNWLIPFLPKLIKSSLTIR